MLDVVDMHIQMAGGKVELNGNADAKNKNKILVNSKTSFQNIHIDSMFYVFENFNQDYLVDKHLKGQIFAEAATHLQFDESLKPNLNELRSTIELTLKNAELNNFETIQRLSKYVEEENLNHLTFADMKNNIEIENKIIYLPLMTIHSNISSIQIGGRHTFDQKIDYEVKVPLKKFIKIKDKDEAFGAIEDDGTGHANLFLIIEGTTDEYDIRYNMKAAKKEFKKDIKNEWSELKEAFEQKGKQGEDVAELEEEEYFEFEED